MEEHWKIEVPNKVIAGRNPVQEALRSGQELESLYIQKNLKSSLVSKIIVQAREKGIPIKEVTSQKLIELTQVEVHQGVAAVIARARYSTLKEIFERVGDEKPFLVLCDGIQDPRNLGAIIRTAEAAGAHGLIIPKRGCVGLTAATVKTSAGAVAYLPVARVPNLTAVIKQLKKEYNMWFYCVDMEGQSWCTTNYSGAVGLVIGAEGDGVSQLLRKNCDFIVGLPMQGQIQSLNASVAAGIILYEVARQRLGLNAW